MSNQTNQSQSNNAQNNSHQMNNQTPAVVDFKPLGQVVVSEVHKVFSKSDFVAISGRYEATRDAMLKLLTSLPIGYTLDITSKTLTDKYASVTLKLKVIFNKSGMERQAESTGTCEMREITPRQQNLHNMITRAETRALKRATETVFGAVVNALILEVMGGYTA